MTQIVLASILLFIIIFFAVRLAIRPLLYKFDEKHADENSISLIKLRDIGIFDNSELEEVIGIYQHRNTRGTENEQYQGFYKVLKELYEIGYLSGENYEIKVKQLKKYYRAD